MESVPHVTSSEFPLKFRILTGKLLPILLGISINLVSSVANNLTPTKTAKDDAAIDFHGNTCFGILIQKRKESLFISCTSCRQLPVFPPTTLYRNILPHLHLHNVKFNCVGKFNCLWSVSIRQQNNTICHLRTKLISFSSPSNRQLVLEWTLTRMTYITRHSCELQLHIPAKRQLTLRRHRVEPSTMSRGIPIVWRVVA